jgi:hypothetical protein
MTDVDETWRPIPSWPNYEASSLGRIRNARTLRVLTPFLDRDRRYAVELPGRSKRRVHLLVAETFHGPRPEGLLTRHLNDDRLDNRPENLAYGTKFDNWQDAVANGVPGMGVLESTCPRGHLHVSPNRTPTQWCVACDRARHALTKGYGFARRSTDLQVVADLYYAKLMGHPT